MSSFEWIPCEHAMPEESGRYLSYWNDGNLEVFDFDIDREVGPNRVGDGWYYPLGGQVITHWSSIPDINE